ncbi:MAG: ferritin-like domain-containing protein [Rhabdochlamydiaceae bacterium]
MTIQSPQDLFFYDLCSMYDVELKLAQILPILAQESQNKQLSEAFLEHQQETVQHARNLEQCFQILDRKPVKLENHTVLGLKEDHDAFLQEKPSPQELTMFNIEAGSKSEYLEMAAYRGLIDSAKLLGLQQCVPLFEQNLRQEEAAAQKLATLAQQIGQTQRRAA